MNFNKWIVNRILKTRRIEKVLNKNNIYDIKSIGENEIYIASYPKSGVTWLQYAMVSLIYGIDVNCVVNDFINLLIPDMHSSKFYIKSGLPTVVKTHCLPRSEMRKVIHLVRDGRDVMASYYAMQKNMGRNYTLSEMMIEDKGVFPCSWGRHCDEWLNNPHNASILQISYEELKNNTFVVFKKICDYIGIIRSDEKINSAIDQTLFSKMQSREKQAGWKAGYTLPHGNFVRQGEVGSYKREIPLELLKKYEQMHISTFKTYGYCVDE
jgi:hypothetical protein